MTTRLVPPSPVYADRKDNGKTDYTTLYPDFLEGMARVWMKNKHKYPDFPDGTPNWHKLWGDETVRKVLKSIWRHVMAIQRGEFYDEETGELHSDHIGCNCQMLSKYFNDKLDK